MVAGTTSHRTIRKTMRVLGEYTGKRLLANPIDFPCYSKAGLSLGIRSVGRIKYEKRLQRYH